MYRTTCTVEHVQDNMYRGTCTVEHIIQDNMYTGQHVQDNVYRTTCTGQHVQDNMYRTTCTVEHIIQDNVYSGTCTVEHVQWSMYRGTCTVEHVQWNMYRGTCAVEYSAFQTQTCLDFRSSDDSFLDECCGCFSLALCGRGDSGEEDGECLLRLRNTQQ